MHILDIGIGIDEDILLRTRMILQSDSGGGKSWAIRKLLEEIAKAGRTQAILFDREGEFTTLREKYNFAHVAVNGGDIPLSVEYAEILAEKLMETNLSAIIDLYDLKEPQRDEFIGRFLIAIMNLRKEHWHNCFFVIDEAQLYCPEGSKSETAMAIMDLSTRGRKRGYCPIFATQRLAELKKTAAFSCQNKLIGLTTGDIDQKRVASIMKLSKQEIESLDTLRAGQFYVKGPAFSAGEKFFRVGQVETTHEEDQKRRQADPPTPEAIRAILSTIGDLPREAEKEATTTEDLRDEIQRLKHIIGDDDQYMKKAMDEKDAQVERLIQEKAQLFVRLESIRRLTDDVEAPFAAIQQLNEPTIIPVKFTHSDTGHQVEENGEMKRSGKNAFTFEIPTKEKRIKANPAVWEGAPTVKLRPLADFKGSKLTYGEIVVLKAIAGQERGAARKQISILTGYTLRTRNAYLQKLMAGFYINLEEERFFITQTGKIYLGDDYKPLPKGKALREFWLNELPAGEAAILKLLIEQYPKILTREEISSKTGYTLRTRNAYIQNLAAKEVATVTGSNVKASEYLF